MIGEHVQIFGHSIFDIFFIAERKSSPWWEISDPHRAFIWFDFDLIKFLDSEIVRGEEASTFNHLCFLLAWLNIMIREDDTRRRGRVFHCNGPTRERVFLFIFLRKTKSKLQTNVPRPLIGFKVAKIFFLLHQSRSRNILKILPKVSTFNTK